MAQEMNLAQASIEKENQIILLKKMLLKYNSNMISHKKTALAGRLVSQE